MIPAWKVEWIRALLAGGRHDYRRIAVLTAVSRGSVGAIAQDLRRRRSDVAEPNETKPRGEAPCDVEPPPGPVVRCPTCGGRVYAPCVLCRTRAVEAKRRARSCPVDRRQRAGRFPG